MTVPILNATIEAARAGEEEFAVAVNEAKELAKQTGYAAKATGRKLQRIVVWRPRRDLKKFQVVLLKNRSC